MKYLLILLLTSQQLLAQINVSPKGIGEEVDDNEIIFEDMTLGSSETNGNKKIDYIKEAFKNFDVAQLLKYSIPAMKQDSAGLQKELDSFSVIFNKSIKVELVESIAQHIATMVIMEEQFLSLIIPPSEPWILTMPTVEKMILKSIAFL